MTVDTVYARDTGFPFRFDEDCNIFVDEDVAIIDQSLTLLSLTSRGTIPLYNEYGSRVNLTVFDPLDPVSQIIVDTSLRTAIEAIENRVFLDKEFTIDSDADNLKMHVSIPYRITVSGQDAATRITIDRPIGE